MLIFVDIDVDVDVLSNVIRCGDTVPSEIYGFLSFQTMIDLIPKQGMSTIYVLTDPAARAAILGSGFKQQKFTAHCRPILRAFFEALTASFPTSIVVVKSGGDPFLDYARIAGAKVAICSASTFCLWPAIASLGKAYFPVTGLVAGWNKQTKVEDMPDLGENFAWLDQPRIITSFQDNTSLDSALLVLSKKNNS